MSDQVVVLRHSLRGEGKRKSDGEWEAFWDSNDNDRDGCDEEPQEFLSFALRIFVVVR
jgi:hypothetical protein